MADAPLATPTSGPLDTRTIAALPTAEQLYAEMLPKVTAKARLMHSADPDGVAADVLSEILWERRYQDRWNPNGKGTLNSYLYGMIVWKLRTHLGRQAKLRSRESLLPPYATADDGQRSAADFDYTEDGFGAVETYDAIVSLRERVADEPEYRVGLASLLDDILGRMLDHEPTTNRALADDFDVAHTTLRVYRKELADVLSSAL